MFSITSYLNSLSEKRFCLLWVFLTWLYYILLSLQGFDMCDEGWVMTGYQQIFNDPQSIDYLFLYYGGQFVGGIWNSLFGWMGIFGFRFLATITILLSFYVLYQLFKEYISRTGFVISIVIISLCYTFGIFVFHHNHLTVLFACILAYFFYKGVAKKSPALLFFSGFVLGVDFFVRIPNIALCSICVVFIPIALNKSINYALRLFFVFGLGILMGCCFVVAILLMSHHFDIFISNLTSGLFAANAEGSTHNLGSMAKTYIKQYIWICVCSILIYLVPLIYSIFKSKFEKLWPDVFTSKIIIVLFTLLHSIILLMLYKNEPVNVFLVYSFAIPIIIFALFRGKNNNVRLLSFMALVIMFSQPMGSDLGISNMGPNSLWLAVPAAIMSIECFALENKYKIYFIVTFIFFFTQGAIKILSNCYFDNGWRWHKTYKISSPLATTFTTKENKEKLDPVLKVLTKYVKENDEVFIFQHTPTLHYLTHTRPYLRNPWVWTYDPDNMERILAKVESSNPQLPILVRDKGVTANWNSYNALWDNISADETYMHKNKRIRLIQEFILRHHYQVVWDSPLFQILKPKDNKNKLYKTSNTIQ